MDYGQKITDELSRQNVFFEGALSEGAGSNSLRNEHEIDKADDLNSENFMPGKRETDALGRAGIDALNNKALSGANKESGIFEGEQGMPSQDEQSLAASQVAINNGTQVVKGLVFSGGVEFTEGDRANTEKVIEKLGADPSAGYQALIEARGGYMKNSFNRELGEAA